MCIYTLIHCPRCSHEVTHLEKCAARTRVGTFYWPLCYTTEQVYYDLFPCLRCRRERIDLRLRSGRCGRRCSRQCRRHQRRASETARARSSETARVRSWLRHTAEENLVAFSAVETQPESSPFESQAASSAELGLGHPALGVDIVCVKADSPPHFEDQVPSPSHELGFEPPLLTHALRDFFSNLPSPLWSTFSAANSERPSSPLYESLLQDCLLPVAEQDGHLVAGAPVEAESIEISRWSADTSDFAAVDHEETEIGKDEDEGGENGDKEEDEKENSVELPELGPISAMRFEGTVLDFLV